MNAITRTKRLTRTLAEQCATLAFVDLPEDVRALARQCLLDYLAVSIAGAAEPLTGLVLAEMEEAGGQPAATVVGRGVRLPALAAALVNGSASHALDFDDVNMAMPGHPTVAILPALLALAEVRGSSGEDVLTAFVAGYELECRIGRALAPGHYDGLGFHATATVGSFGAAGACARLLGLSADATAAALGIAGTQAAGLKSMFGTMCKPLHAGKAAYHGLLAAKLAARGFTSRDDVLECSQGFASTHSPDFHPDAALAEPRRGWHVLDNLFKYHAACYLTHGPIEAARAVRADHGLSPGQLARVTLRVDQAADRVCNIAAPRTGLEAKFSLRLTTAMALAGVETGALGSYSEANAADPVLVGLRDRVSLDFQSGWPHTLAEIEVECEGGTRFTARHDAGVPASDIPGQGERLEHKFAALVEPVLGVRADEIIAVVRRLEELAELRGLMTLVA